MKATTFSILWFVALVSPIFPQKAGTHDESPLNLSLFPGPITSDNLPLSQALGTVGAYVQGGYVLFGVELRTKDGKEPLVKVNLPSGSHLSDGLEQIMNQIPGYKYDVISPHMINIYPAGAKDDPADVLNIPVPQFDAADVDPAQILSGPADFIPQLAARLRPEGQPRGSVGDIMRGVNAPSVTLHLEGTTVRQILNSTSDATGQLPPDSQPLGWFYIFQPDPKLPAGGKHSWRFLFSAPNNWKLGFGQASDPKSSAVVDQIMATALSRCYSVTADGVKAITFVPATNEEVAEVQALGRKAVAPLARYLDLKQKNGLTQFFAVRFLMEIGGNSTLGPLKRAFAQDQWEVVRDAALDGIFRVSPTEAKPYLEAALGDRSQVVRQNAQHLWSLYQRQIK
jgi:hypothetical protein